MTTINRPPRALQDLLQLQTKGRNPNDLLDTIQATMDVTRLILSDVEWEQEQKAFTVNAATVPANFAQVEVPAGELWWVHAISLMSNVATALFDLNISIADVDSASADAFLASTTKEGAGTFAKGVCVMPPGGLLVPSGQKIGCFTQFASANFIVTTRVLFNRLKY